MKPSNPTEWYRACVCEALEQRAAEHDAQCVATASRNPQVAVWLRERADECRRIAKLLRHDDLPGCEAEDHL